MELGEVLICICIFRGFGLSRRSWWPTWRDRHRRRRRVRRSRRRSTPSARRSSRCSTTSATCRPWRKRGRLFPFVFASILILPFTQHICIDLPTIDYRCKGVSFVWFLIFPYLHQWPLLFIFALHSYLISLTSLPNRLISFDNKIVIAIFAIFLLISLLRNFLRKSILFFLLKSSQPLVVAQPKA